MRAHRIALLAATLVLTPTLASAQRAATNLSGRQLVEYEACMQAAGNKEGSTVECLRKVEAGSIDDTTPASVAPAAPPEGGTVDPSPATEATPTAPAAPAEVTEPSAPEAATDAAPTPTASGADQRTEAERDFDSLYRNDRQDYNPVADPTLPAPADVGSAYDPWERYNRQMHRFNNAVDRAVARPLARAYVRVVPRPVRLGVSNFFNNLGQPVSMVNALLQGKPKQAAQSLGRFALNSTLGIGGVFDPASDAKLPAKSEDFGQTLGTWGWKRSRYVELPLFGPRTVRDTLGLFADAPLSPVRQVEADDTRLPLQFLQMVDVRAQLLSTDSLREGVEDDYALVRDAWSQRRNYQIFGDRQLESDDSLPDYLREENNPQVPVDAMPVLPPDVQPNP